MPGTDLCRGHPGSVPGSGLDGRRLWSSGLSSRACPPVGNTGRAGAPPAPPAPAPWVSVVWGWPEVAPPPLCLPRLPCGRSTLR